MVLDMEAEPGKARRPGAETPLAQFARTREIIFFLLSTVPLYTLYTLTGRALQ